MVYFPLVRSAQYQLVVVPAVFSALSILAVGLRVLCRRLANRVVESSDYIMVASLVVSVAFSGVTMAGAYVGGGGYHVTELVAGWGMEPIQTFLKLGIAVQALWATSISLCKISILVLYAKVFTVRSFVIAANTTAAIVILWALGTVLGGLLQCHPFAYNWDQTIAGGSCSNQILSYKITGAINIVTDVIVLVLPMPYLARLELKLYKKLVLMATFAGGFFTCIVGALRLHSITSMDYSDITYTVVEAEVFSAVEPALAITLACIPMLRPLLSLGARYSPTGTRYGPPDVRRSSTRLGSKSGFETIHENGSEYQLRPVGPVYNADITAKSIAGSQGSGSGGEEAGASEFGTGRARIGVKQEWAVNEERI